MRKEGFKNHSLAIIKNKDIFSSQLCLTSPSVMVSIACGHLGQHGTESCSWVQAEWRSSSPLRACESHTVAQLPPSLAIRRHKYAMVSKGPIQRGYVGVSSVATKYYELPL